MTEIESEVEPNGVADDIERESVAFVSVHPQIIDQWQLTCQYQRNLSISQVRKFHDGLNIPLENLIDAN